MVHNAQFRAIGILTGALISVAIMVMLGGCGRSRETCLEFMLRDAVSDAWVWDATITIQDRTSTFYYQTGDEPGYVRISGLTPGEASLTVRAPSYAESSTALMLRRGPNRLEEPVRISGLEIPGLDRFVIFVEPLADGLGLEIRPLVEDGSAIRNHPAMPIWIGAVISEQFVDGQPGRDSVESGASRGRELFRGFADIKFDPAPEVRYRYQGHVPAAGISGTDAPFWVVDFLVVVPDFRVVESDAVLRAMNALMSAPIEQLPAMVAAGFEGIDTYAYTSWNVPEVAR